MLLDCSNALLLAVKKKQSSEIVRILNLFATFSFQDAVSQLKSDAEKKVFWVNVYNSYFQIIAAENKKNILANQSNFFKRKQLNLLGLKLSFDDLEHSILRRSKWKFGLGYLNKPFTKKWEKKLRVKQLDYRVHFVLNCGAVSCPVIYPLAVNGLNLELEEATQSYLSQEVTIKNNKIELNRLFLFYIGDFGGRKGLKGILRQYDIIQEKHFNYKFKFTEFDKGAKLDNFIRN
ncbi:MAG: hypothetical protein ACI8ZM_004206 [Crocinitomix sp.]|jgi:hypothetical protein